jgi:hypothetical protein
VEAKSYAGLSEAGAGTSPFPGPSHNPCRGWSKSLGFLALAISLWMLYFAFDALLLVISHHPLTGQLARDWSRPISKGQFPFPLAPEFWDSWNDSWLKTSLSAYGANAERDSSSFKPL